MEFQFEWDEKKAAINVKKHGVSFQTASKVFYDPQRIEAFDDTHSINEDRYVTIGMSGKVLFVVFTNCHPKIRLISARLATVEERSIYYGELYPEWTGIE